MGFFFVLKRSCSGVRPFPLINGKNSLLALISTSFSGFQARTLISSRPFFVSSFRARRGPKGSFWSGKRLDFASLLQLRLFSSQASALSAITTSDGLTVGAIVSKGWPILDESESDWRSHAAAIAQSIQLIKKRLQWRKMIVRLEQLSVALNKSDLWDDPVYAGRISREHGELMGKIKAVNRFEQELLEHIDLLKLAREEDDKELELVGSCF